MSTPRNIPSELESLLRLIGHRFERRRRLRGWVRFGFASLLLLVLLAGLLAAGDAAGLPRLPAIVLVALGAAAAAWRWLIAPARRPLPLSEIAFYIDEHHPELENRIVSAVEFSQHADEIPSEYLLNQFFDEIRQLTPHLELPPVIDQRSMQRLSRLAACVWTVAIVGIFTIQQLWFPVRLSWSGREPTPERPVAAIPDFQVDPGDVRVRRGSNQVILVTSRADGLARTIRWRTPDSDDWQSELMQPGSAEHVHYHQYLRLAEDLEYQVLLGDYASDIFHIDVWTPPEVTGIDLVYHYPEYLGLPVNHVANGGDIAAVEGTRVELEVEVNKPLQSATMVLAGGDPIALEPAGELLWRGEIEIAENDTYHIELVDTDGERSEYHREYRITAIEDAPPEIRIAFPRGDGEATMIEEVPIAFRLSDDHGIVDFGIEYNVAGRDPIRVSLRPENLEADRIEQTEANHLLMLETLELMTGDLVTWTVWATDGRPDRQAYETVGDPYFLEIRPFRRTFMEAVSDEGDGAAQQQQQQQGQGGQDGQGRQEADQKELIIATWNLRRDAGTLDENEFRRRLETIVEAQRSLLEQSEQGPAGMPGAMPLGPQPSAEDGDAIREAMQRAVEALQSAEFPAPEQQLSEALVHEQEAYRQMLRQRLEESQVRQSRQANASQFQNQAQARELQQLEMDRRNDFFEEASTRERQQQQAEQSLSNLRELTQRQELLNRDMTQLLSEMEQATEEEREELQRQLERLRREQQQNMEQLDQLAGQMAASGEEQQRQAQQQMQQAREQMNRTRQNLEQGELQQARASGNRAAEALNQAEEQLQQLAGGLARQRMQQLADRMEQLVEQQQQVVDGARRLQEEFESPHLQTADETRRNVNELLDRKEAIEHELTELMQQTAELAERTGESQELASRQLGDWLRNTSRRGFEEAIDEGRPLIEFGIYGAAVAHEESVREQLEEAAAELGQVQQAMIDSEIEAMERALARLRELMDDRATSATQLAQAGRPGAEQQNRAGGAPVEDGEEAQGPPAGEEGERQTAQAGEEQGDRPAGGQGEENDQGRPGGSPGQDQQEARAGDQSGGRPGEQQEGRPGGGQGQPGEPNQQGQGDRQLADAGQPGQSGMQPGDRQPGQQPGQQPGLMPGAQPGQTMQPGRPGERAGAGGFQPGQPLDPENPQLPRGLTGGEGGGGPWWSDDGAFFRGEQFAEGLNDPEAMRRFLESDYRRWVDALREAEALLPRYDETRARLAGVRTELDEMRRDFLREDRIPRFDYFLDEVATPLAFAADALQRAIARQMQAGEFALADETEIPAQYADRVAQYFEALSELEQQR